ncbi:hypothetical protein AQ490_07935 [Wenjunlia vitaminophila]|uniref:MobA-like NTP transferase domain-containing protein n=1 Tax=Wenjunlia vitaminophila TaxID=76728 RepID=A0A0T6LMZ5_WENVI|nr:NTP transferase domain-containing protein [Wenjunlia vitaminophila]KRV47381.1 hypothetical protein AQ490_07935 [Wenjunlia vitaminophila]
MLTGVTDYDAIILAGGQARRLGGVDKPGLRVGGSSLLERVLGACAGAARLIVVGPPRPVAEPHTAASVRWTRENPPGGGPLPALAAGLELVTADLVLLLAADLPFMNAGTVRRLLAEAVSTDTFTPGDTSAPAGAPAGAPADVPGGASGGADTPDGAVLVDADGHDQPLAAAYRTESLRAGLDRLTAEHGTLAGVALRRLVSPLTLRRVADREGTSFDCDTWDDVTAVRARMGEV